MVKRETQPKHVIRVQRVAVLLSAWKQESGANHLRWLLGLLRRRRVLCLVLAGCRSSVAAWQLVFLRLAPLRARQEPALGPALPTLRVLVPRLVQIRLARLDELILRLSLQAKCVSASKTH